ncbi:hypothetical protein [Streptomyces phaeoluteigriseus]
MNRTRGGLQNRTGSGKDVPPPKAGLRGEASAYDKLWTDLREATAAVPSHTWWTGARRKASRGRLWSRPVGLKHADGAVPLQQSDIEAAA